MSAFRAVTVVALAALVSCVAATGGFNYQTFDSTIGLYRVGPARQGPPTKLLLTSLDHNEAGAMWVDQQIDFSVPFTTTFRFVINRFGNTGADGMAFVIQNTGDSSIGQPASELGYGRIGAGLAVEFDTYQNVPLGDPNDNHISIHWSNTQLTAHEDANSKYFIVNETNRINSGISHSVTISTAKSGSNWTMTIKYDTTTFTHQIPSIPSLLGGSLGFVGFTAATGGADQDHYLKSWQFIQTDTPTSCAPGYIAPHCSPNDADKDNVCGNVDDCTKCTTNAYPCVWADDHCHAQGTTTGAQYLNQCPSGGGSTPTSYTWVWILLSVAIVIVATIGILWYYKRRASNQAVSNQYGYL